MFGRYGFRNLTTDRSAEHPAAVRRRRQRPHLRAQPPVRVRLDLDADGHVAARGAVRLFVDAGRQEPAGARQRQRARPVRPAGPARRSAHRRRPADPGRSPATRISAARRPIRSGSTRRSTTRRSTTPGRRGAHSFKSGYEFQRIDTEVQDVNPLYGRDTYNGSFTAPTGRGGEQPLQPRRLHARPARRSTRSAACWSRTCAATCTSPTSRTTGASTRKLTLNLGLRYEFSTPYWERDNVLSNFDPATNCDGPAPRTARSTTAR